MKKFIIVVAKSFLYFIGWAMLASFIPLPNTEIPAIWRFWAELVPFLCIVGITFLFWLIERRKTQVFPICHFAKDCVIGILGGAVWLGLTFLIMLFLGVLKVESVNTVSFLWLWIFSVFINTVMQELLVRGYLYQLIKGNYNVVCATIISSALFTFMHGGAFEAGIIPVLNVLSMSLLMTVVLEYTHSLLVPIIMHFFWNAVGAVILGGVSLAEDYPHLFTITFDGSTLLSGGIYKMEGSIVVLILNLILIAVLMFFLRQRAKE